MTKNSEGKLIIRFVYIYRIFELGTISLSLVRLWMLYQAKENSLPEVKHERRKV